MNTHDNEKNLAVSPEVLEQAIRQAEAEGKTVDELAQEAIKRHLARKSLDRFQREAEARRGNKTDEEVEAIVTHDKDLLRMKEYQGIRMVKVLDFLQEGPELRG